MKTKNGITDLLYAAYSDFKRNKVRTILTSLGITIGVLSVVMLIALGLGLKNYIKQQFENLGTNLLVVLAGSGFSGGNPQSFGPGMVTGVRFDERDVSVLKRVSEIDYVVPVYFKSASVQYNGQKETGFIFGTTEEVFTLLNLKSEAGSFLSKSDIQSASKNVVLGFSLAEKIFEDVQNVEGKIVRLENQRFRVVGVTQKKGDNEMDNAIFMSYKTTFGSINPDKEFFTIYLGVDSEENIASAKTKAEEALLKRYEDDQFSVTEQAEILSTVNQIFSVINGVLVAIGSISLLVGGIGIMNIMYASVTERTKEVGIRRAIGATEKDILLQFLAESVLLSLFGGFMGLLIAFVIVLIVRAFFPASINLFSVAITLFVSSSIGIFFGVFPARRAAKLPPIEAIRYE